LVDDVGPHAGAGFRDRVRIWPCEFSRKARSNRVTPGAIPTSNRARTLLPEPGGSRRKLKMRNERYCYVVAAWLGGPRRDALLDPGEHFGFDEADPALS
jgi:hypothetical protein